MAEPTTASDTGVSAGASGAQTGLTQAEAGALSTAIAQMQAQLNSLSENVDKVAKSTTSDVDSETVVRSSLDPASPQRRQEAYAELALANAVSFQSAMNALIVRKVSQDTDHHGAIPPIAPRSATGPGVSAS